MAERNDLPDWREVVEERARLGSLEWSARPPLRIKVQQRIDEAVASWLVAPTEHASEAELAHRLGELDYLDEAGRTTDAAKWAQAALDPQGLTSMRIFTRDHSGRRALIIGFDHEQAIVLSNDDEGEWGLGYTATELLPELIARWLPITPAYSFDIIDRAISDDELEPAVARAAPETNEGAAYVDALLERPWMQWVVQLGPGETNEFVTVDGWGSFALDREGETISLAPVLSAELVLLFVDGILGTLELAAEAD